MNDMPRRLQPPANLIPPPADGEPPRPSYRPRQSGPFGVLDIGSTKIACIIGRVESDLSLRVLGFGWQKGNGIRAGGIVDLEAAERAIRACVGQAEEQAGTRLHKVAVNLSCGTPRSQVHNIQSTPGGRAVTEADIRRMLVIARDRATAEGRSIIHTMSVDFETDDAQGIADPRGLHCDNLTAHIHVIDAATTALRNLDACLARCDLEISELASAPLVAAQATLVDDDRLLGATLIDMGGGTTGIASFAGGHLLHTAQIGIGGGHVTNDLASILNTPTNHAERLKTLYGSAEISPDDERQLLPVPPIGEDETTFATTPRSQVINIIKPRLEETFEHVKACLDEQGVSRHAGHRIILTGGASQLSGIADLAQRVLGHQVRLASPTPPRGLPDRADSPAFATTIGLFAWAAGAGRPAFELESTDEPSGGLMRRIVNFLRERL